MKTIATILFAALSFAASAQNVTRDKAGNFHAIPDSVKQAAQVIPTEYTYTDKAGHKAPVYVTAAGKYYVLRTSKKTGKQYRYYLNTEAPAGK